MLSPIVINNNLCNHHNEVIAPNPIPTIRVDNGHSASINVKLSQ